MIYTNTHFYCLIEGSSIKQSKNECILYYIFLYTSIIALYDVNASHLYNV